MTKRLHNRLHGAAGRRRSARPRPSARIYEQRAATRTRATLAAACSRRATSCCCTTRRPPGWSRRFATAARTSIWRCHVGARRAQRPRALGVGVPAARTSSDADAYVFSREAFAWEDLDPDAARRHPALDRRLRPEEPARSTPRRVTRDPRAPPASAPGDRAAKRRSFTRTTAAPARVERRPSWSRTRRCRRRRPLVDAGLALGRAQGSRSACSTAFAEHVAAADGRASRARRARDVAAVADDPEGAEVLAESVAAGASSCPDDARARPPGAAARWTTSRRTPRSSTRSSAAPTSSCQKSLAEGFGLTVAEAMWKARPVVASARRRDPGPDRGRRDRRAGRPARPRRLRRAP